LIFWFGILNIQKTSGERWKNKIICEELYQLIDDLLQQVFKLLFGL